MGNLRVGLGTEMRCVIFRLCQSYSLSLMNLGLKDEELKKKTRII
jgi:hypothetical protein